VRGGQQWYAPLSAVRWQLLSADLLLIQCSIAVAIEHLECRSIVTHRLDHNQSDFWIDDKAERDEKLVFVEE